jgi:hypothetical protein
LLLDIEGAEVVRRTTALGAKAKTTASGERGGQWCRVRASSGFFDCLVDEADELCSG